MPAHAVKKQRHRTKAKTVAVRKPTAITTPDELPNFDRYPRNVKQLISNALELSNQHLTYKFGSSDPNNKGMDCSGTISYLLKQLDVDDVPRQSDEIYQWAYENGVFSAVNSHKFGTFEFSKLKPGDLLFWSGTYPVKRDPAITHVMMYLGRDKDNRPLMFGATSGGTYRGHSQSGVSVFDFYIPSGKSKARFLGYACIPHLTCD
jgi:cell wall-associated NlpC family hydrolase